MATTYGEAIRKLEAYKELHGRKLDAPWRKNPNINFLTYIDHWIGLFGKKPSDEVVTGIVERNIAKMTPNRPPISRSGCVKLDRSECEIIANGGEVIREVVSGVIVKIMARR